MRATGPSYAWPLVVGLIVLTGCQQAAEPASAEPSDLGAATGQAGRRKPTHAGAPCPAPKPRPAKTDEPKPTERLDDASAGWNEPIRKTANAKSSTKTVTPVVAPKLQPEEQSPSPAPPTPAPGQTTSAPAAQRRPDDDLGQPDKGDAAETASEKPSRRTKPTPVGPTLDLGSTRASTPRTRTGIALPGEVAGRVAPTGAKTDYDYAANTWVVTGSGQAIGAATDTGSTAPAPDTPRRPATSAKSAPSTIVLRTPDAADRPARPAPSDAATLPATGNGQPGRTTRTALPLRLSEWLADEKTHEEWRRRQQAKLAATSAERESERRRLKAALDQLVRKDVEPESRPEEAAPAEPAAGK